MRFRPCIIIPIYDHEDTIAKRIAALAPYRLHCFIIDDGSGEPTRRQLENLASKNSALTIRRIEKNTGKGAAVMLGLQMASRRGYTHALQIDADEQHDASDVPRLLAMAEKHPEAVVAGQPVLDDSLPAIRRWSRRITHFWVGIETFSLEPPDTMCGLRVYPVAPTLELIEKARPGRRMDFDIEIMVRMIWAGVPLVTLPVRVRYPLGGKSHFMYFRDNVLISWMHMRLVCGSLKRLLWVQDAVDASKAPARHWSNTKERGAVLGIRLLLWTYRLLGRKIYHLILLPVVAYFFFTGREARNASRTFLQRAYDARSTHPALQNPPSWRTSFRHFLEFGDSAIDTMAAWMGDLSENDLVFENRDEFFRVADSGSGAVIIGAHLGNMNVCRALASRDATAHLAVVMFTEHAANFNKVLRQVNPKATEGVLLLEKMTPDIAITLQHQIENGRILVLLGDRTPAGASKHVNEVQFLGHPALLPQGPFVIARLLRCPVYLMFCIKGQTKYHVYLEAFENDIELARTTREQDLRRCVQRYAARLEHYALKEPFQWFNFYDFWHEGS